MKILVKNPKNEILEKIQVKNSEKEKPILFIEQERSMYKNNPEILNKYFRNEEGHSCCYANLLAFDKEANLKDVKKILEKDFGKPVSLKGYKHNPEHYRFASALLQNEYEEDLFRNSEDEALPEYYSLGLEELDYEAVNTLTKVLWKAIKQRYVMILNLEGIPGLIHNALDCKYNGINCSASNNAMRSKIEEIRNLLENKDVKAWLETGASDMSFDKNEYISVYQKILKQLTSIRSELDKDLFKEQVFDLIHNEYDIFEENILDYDTVEETPFSDNLIGYDFDKGEYFFSEAYEEDDNYLD